MAQQPDPETEKPLKPAIPASIDQLRQQLEQLLPKRTDETQADTADEEESQ